jgi:hypothetical protein
MADTDMLPCGHAPEFEVEWVETRSYARVHVNFCVACNYESISNYLKETSEQKNNVSE